MISPMERITELMLRARDVHAVNDYAAGWASAYSAAIRDTDPDPETRKTLDYIFCSIMLVAKARRLELQELRAFRQDEMPGHALWPNGVNARPHAKVGR